MGHSSKTKTPISKVDWEDILDKYIEENLFSKVSISSISIIPNWNDYRTLKYIAHTYLNCFLFETTYDEVCFLLLIIIEAIKTGDLE